MPNTPDTPVTPVESSDNQNRNYQEKFDKIKQDISNPTDAFKNSLEDGFIDYVKNLEDSKKTDLKDGISGIIEKVNKWELKLDGTAKENLKKLAVALSIQVQIVEQDSGSGSQDSGNESSESQEVKELPIKWTLEGVEEASGWRFYSQIDQKPQSPTPAPSADKGSDKTKSEDETEAEGGDESSDAVDASDAVEGWASDESVGLSKVEETEKTISDNLSKIEELLKDDKLPAKEKLQTLKASYLEKIQIVMKSPTIKNTKILQEFISQNLEWEDKTTFDSKNKAKSRVVHKRWKNGRRVSVRTSAAGWFDGRFWISTLEWLNKVLEKVDSYVGAIKPQETPSTPSTDNQNPNPSSNWENPTPSTDSNPSTPSAASWENQPGAWTGQSGSQSPDWGSATWAAGNESMSSGHSIETTQTTTISNLVPNAEQVIIINNNPEKTFKVKTDFFGNLCPIMDQVNNHLNWLTSKALIKNNESCKNYLKTALGNIPDAPNVKIGRNPIKEDYELISHGQSITIEPMTIDGKWMSGDLSTDLKLLNLTNYLKSWDPDLKNNDANVKWKNGKLYARLDKKQWNGKWQEINLDSFGLGDRGTIVNKDLWEKFKKYNNGEHWEDNWDKKDPNKYYRKVEMTTWAVLPGNVHVPVGAPTYSASQYSYVEQHSSGVGQPPQQLNQPGQIPVQPQQPVQAPQQPNQPDQQPVQPQQS